MMIFIVSFTIDLSVCKSNANEYSYKGTSVTQFSAKNRITSDRDLVL